MSSLRGTEAKMKKTRQAFKKLFKLSPEGTKGNIINYDFVKEKVKTKEGLTEIRDLFDTFIIDRQIPTDKPLSEILGFKNKGLVQFSDTLSELHKDFNNPEKVEAFKTKGLGLKPVVEVAPVPDVKVSKVTKVSSPKEEEETKVEIEEKQQMKPEPLPPPVMSPDERDQAKAEQKAEEKAEEKPQQSVKMEMEKPEAPPTKKPDPTEIDKLEPLPSKSDFIPPMRLGTRGKDINELLSDINYFFKNFKSQLKRESEIFKDVNKSDIEQLRKLHDRIVGKLAPKPKKEEGKKVGIIVNADEYIREQMKKILQEQTFSSLRPQDVIIDVGSREAEGRQRDTKDFGDFAVKRTIDGGLASQREAIFRYMPSENDPDVGEEGMSRKQKAKPKRLNLPPPRLNNERTNAIRRNVNNPFRIPQRKSRISFLY